MKRYWFGSMAACAIVISVSCALLAQGPPGQDRGNPPPGHGGMPPGQAKKQERGLPPGQEKRYEEGKSLPPGQARKYLRDADRGRFYEHYRRDVDRWRGRRRPLFETGRYIPRGYAIQPVPRSVWMNAAAPPPPGCRYGYYGGYVMAYNPTTRMIADVLDLVDAARSR